MAERAAHRCAAADDGAGEGCGSTEARAREVVKREGLEREGVGAKVEVVGGFCSAAGVNGGVGPHNENR